MNQDESLDLWSQISFPQWMANNGEDFDLKPIPGYEERKRNENDAVNFGKFQQEIQPFQIKPVSQKPNNKQAEIEQFGEQKVSSYQNEDQEQKSENKDNKNNINMNKMQRRCLNSKNYRQRKREYYKSLQQENRILKLRIEELNFKLSEKQKQINKLRNNDPLFTNNYETQKSKRLKQLQQILNDKSASQQEFVQAGVKLKQILSFDSKQKMDYLNYFMSELMQNVINDRVLYFMDCLINKKGVHRQSHQQELRKIDIEVIEILAVDLTKIKDVFIEKHKAHLAQQASRLKQLWKKLYQIYLAVLNQGTRLQRAVEPLKNQLRKYVDLSNCLRVDLHFEKNKHRQDIRYLRNSWLKELQYESFQNQTPMLNQKQSPLRKRIKLIQ